MEDTLVCWFVHFFYLIRAAPVVLRKKRKEKKRKSAPEYHHKNNICYFHVWYAVVSNKPQNELPT